MWGNFVPVMAQEIFQVTETHHGLRKNSRCRFVSQYILPMSEHLFYLRMFWRREELRSF